MQLRDETLQKLTDGEICEKFIAVTPARSARAGDFH
jgi:hypothetical protein